MGELKSPVFALGPAAKVGRCAARPGLAGGLLLVQGSNGAIQLQGPNQVIKHITFNTFIKNI